MVYAGSYSLISKPEMICCIQINRVQMCLLSKDCTVLGKCQLMIYEQRCRQQLVIEYVTTFFSNIPPGKNEKLLHKFERIRK